jgi:isoquinoline 1-oxidoreductase beta subunit
MTTQLQGRGMKLTRRDFLKAGGGLALGFTIGPNLLLSVFDAHAATGGVNANAWVHIAADGTISIMLPSSEMGQGIMTSLPLLLAEELDADWSKVKVVQAHVDGVFNNPVHFNVQGIGGSRSIRGYWPIMRLAGGQARYVLLVNAAQRWGVPVAECATLPGKVIHQASGREMSYGEIAAFAKVPADMPQLTEKDLKTKDQWRLIGRDVPRVEVPTKVNGTAVYGMDIQLPGMLYASLARPPVATCPYPIYNDGAENGPLSVDDSEALKIEGVVKVVKLPHAVAVVGTDYWATVKGRRALKVEWKKGSLASKYNTEAKLDEYGALARDLSKKGTSLAPWNTGDADAAFKSAAKTVSALYLNDHVHHACMEPFNGTGWLHDGQLDLWVPTQGQTWARDVGNKVTGVPKEKIHIHTPLLGGGFGAKVEQVFTGEAAALAKAVEGKPVKIVWSREDDVKHGAYRPATAQFMRAAVTADGKVSAWSHRVAGDSVFLRSRKFAWDKLQGFDGIVAVGVATPYGIPNKQHAYLYQESGIPVGYWNAIGNGYTLFAIESFMDEVAVALGKDPLALRLELMTDKRSKAVLEEVGRMAQWDRKRPEGRALGLAYNFGGEWNAPIAEIVEVSLDKVTGAIKVHKVWAAMDPAVAVQPKHLTAQIETGIIWGLSAALRERITIKNGEVQESNFYDYPVPRMDEIPDIEIKLVDSGVVQPSGAGQIGVPPVAPAIANAVYRLTGVRLRAIPMLPARVKVALEAGNTKSA